MDGRPGSWARRWGGAMLAAAALWPAAAGAAEPGVVLGVEPPDFAVATDGLAGGLLLRELQRQAVLIAVRDELGLRGRDAVLGERDADVTVGVVPQTRVWRGKRAELRLTDAHGNAGPWASFPLSDDPLVDYPAFVAAAEAASRGAYADLLRGRCPAGRPTGWADGEATADPTALVLLDRMDVFSQLRAVRLLHGQLRAATGGGASAERLSALVRAYANLGQLACNEWSAQPKAYAARSLLYAERLVVHDRASAASLYARAYARGMVDLTAAALDDMDRADRLPGPRPPWAAAVRAYCHRDVAATAAAWSSWRRDRPLATLLGAYAAFDGYPPAVVRRSVDAALLADPGPLVLMTACAADEDAYLGHLVDVAPDVLPTLARTELAGADLPPSAAAAVRRLSPPRPDGPANLGELARARAALTLAGIEDGGEPSCAAYGSLLQEEAFAAVVRVAVNVRQSSGQNAGPFVASVEPVLADHPWGPLVRAMAIDAAADPEKFKREVDRVPASAAGPWAGRSAADQVGGSDDLARDLHQRWDRPAHLMADNLVGDFSDAMAMDQAARACGGDLGDYLRRLRRTDPHSAVLAAAWMHAAGDHPDAATFEAAVSTVSAEFPDRPDALTVAADWCQARGAFDRAGDLLWRLDRVAPSDAGCERLGRTAWRAGHHDAAVAAFARGARLAEGQRRAELWQVAAAHLMSAGRADEAAVLLDRAEPDAAEPDAAESDRDVDYHALLGRCLDLQGRPDAADAVLRRRAALSPQGAVDYALWARRLGRPSAEAAWGTATAAVAANRAAAVAGGQSLAVAAAFDLAWADGPPGPAVDVLRKAQDGFALATDWARLAGAAAAAGDAALVWAAVDKAAAVTDPPAEAGFGVRFAALARGGDPTAAAFDAWCDRQLDPEAAVTWHQLAGAFLLAAGHGDAGRSQMAAVLASGARERAEYFLAWRATR